MHRSGHGGSSGCRSRWMSHGRGVGVESSSRADGGVLGQGDRALESRSSDRGESPRHGRREDDHGRDPRPDPRRRRISMTAVLVDSNVLLDVATQDTRWLQWSERALREAAETAPLVINPLDLRRGLGFLPSHRRPRPGAAEHRSPAGSAPVGSRLPGRQGLSAVSTAGRIAPLSRTSISEPTLPSKSLRLPTRDAARYRTGFPSVELIAP